MEIEIHEYYNSSFDDEYYILDIINDIVICLTYSQNHGVFNLVHYKIDYLKDYFKESGFKKCDEYIKEEMLFFYNSKEIKSLNGYER